MDINTHLAIDRRLCGTPVAIDTRYARVEMALTEEMTADAAGLVHGGFIFGLADYAAMLAVNDPNVVLGGADVTFLKPVAIEERVVAEASVEDVKGKKHVVHVMVKRETETVFRGVFTCFVLEKHVLE
ncbi:MAG: PaaI family thioesterase [Deltaproteobacteria bacterium]|nr:PaaI family thioesterase [Deltaproteobacteria bacterium]